ncbi:hypothetical protein HY009_05790 [Candidatus Acetothermia bacterium]|nr:hypothetical protein [Candidatus Acetothermia bacterium]
MGSALQKYRGYWIWAMVGFVLALSSVSATAWAAEPATSFRVLVELQASGFRFSVHAEDVTAVRVAILRLDGRPVFQSDWVAGPTVIWSLASSSNQTPTNGVYLYGVSARDQQGREQRKLGKLVVSFGAESQLSLPGLDQLAGSQPSSLPSGVKWQEKLGKDSIDNFRIQRQPGKGQAFQNLLTLDNAGNLSVAQLCLSGVCFASWPSGGGGTFELADGSVTLAKLANQDCGAGNAIRGWTAGVLDCVSIGGGGGASSGWVDDGTVVRLATATDKVGIGTISPSFNLDVAGSLRAGGSAANDIVVQTSGGTNAWARFGMQTTNQRWLLGTSQNFNGDQLYLVDDTHGQVRMTIQPNGGDISFPTGNVGIAGNVGIGTTSSPALRLAVVGQIGNTSSLGLNVYNEGFVQIGTLYGSSTLHACYSTILPFAFDACSSAAEYVPTVDTGQGYPEAADLVSIIPQTKNPYGDDHGPFIVAKTSTPCDENLIGFILDPKSGADGKKLNDHYLPLAIYGYFPARVTMENGPIKRGDPITSSSKPGYGMRATQACKIIGYALEDADKEGTIQVFAHLSENAAPEVTQLRAKVQELQKELGQLTSTKDQKIEELQQRIEKMEKLMQELVKK